MSSEELERFAKTPPLVERPSFLLLPNAKSEMLKAGNVQLPYAIASCGKSDPGGKVDLVMFVRAPLVVTGGTPAIAGPFVDPPEQKSYSGLSVGNVSLSLGKDGHYWVFLAVPYRFAQERDEMVALVNDHRPEFEANLLSVAAPILRLLTL
ncbi:hypothetical protein [Maioricimonas sp. JC845]|uniref:hypothetical protein n=1 Tax=Maioricimonas sp. JC845 TaxID=3232138 RepID=UPI00345A2BCE